jgi:RHS repeat-associated protein
VNSIRATSGTTAITPFGYAGGYTDTTGLIYLINRYYDPATGQFISVDPQLTQTQQPYSYAGGDPVDATDPPGQSLPGGGSGGHDPCGVGQTNCNDVTSHWSLNEPATEWSIRMLENVIDGEENADAVIFMLPDVVGIVINLAGGVLSCDEVQQPEPGLRQCRASYSGC